MPECAIFGTDPSPATRLVACIDRSDHAAHIIDAASHFAEALGAPLTLFHVLEPDGPFMLRPDPVESEFQRHQSRRRLQSLIDGNARTRGKVLPEIVEGDSAAEICQRAAAPGTILVLGRSSGGGACGVTIHRVIEQTPGPVLVVPVGCSTEPGQLRRLLVPLDGSSFAETALVPACRIARQTGAEIVLVHIVPDAELTQIGPLDVGDIELRERLTCRNDRIGRAYLECLEQRLVNQGLGVRTICTTGDVRTTLSGLITELGSDLVVLSARGQGVRHCLDLPFGNVTSYLLSHAAVPLLVVRPVAAPTAERFSPAALNGFQPRPFLAH